NLFRDSHFVKSVKEACEPIQKRLLSQEFLVPEERKDIIGPAGAMGLLVILALGIDKLVAAIEKGRHNIAFLIILGVFGSIALCIACAVSFPRVSKRGRIYLARVKSANKTLQTNPLGGRPSYNELLLAVAMFGFAPLAGSEYGSLYN